MNSFAEDHERRDETFAPSAADILEAHSCSRALRAGEIDRFIRYGVSVQSLSAPYPVLIADVAFLANGYFEFAEDYSEGEAQKAFVFIAEGATGPIDIVAWQPTSNRTALWLKRAIALGEEQVWLPRWDNQPLAVLRTPMKWLIAQRQGLVILQPARAHQLLGNLSAIVAEDLDHGTELEILLTPPKPRTQILVPARAKVINVQQTDDCEAA